MEVHKTDSSDDEEMEDAVPIASTSESRRMMDEQVSSNESVSMDEIRPDWAATPMNTGGDTSGSEVPFELAPVRCEQSTSSPDDNV